MSCMEDIFRLLSSRFCKSTITFYCETGASLTIQSVMQHTLLKCRSQHPFPNRNHMDDNLSNLDFPFFFLGNNRQPAHGQYLIELYQRIHLPLFSVRGIQGVRHLKSKCLIINHKINLYILVVEIGSATIPKITLFIKQDKFLSNILDKKACVFIEYTR